MGIRQKILVYELQNSEAIVSHWFYLCLSAHSSIGPCFSSLIGFKGQFALPIVIIILLKAAGSQKAFQFGSNLKKRCQIKTLIIFSLGG